VIVGWTGGAEVITLTTPWLCSGEGVGWAAGEIILDGVVVTLEAAEIGGAMTALGCIFIGL